jgi:hypothetical protein
MVYSALRFVPLQAHGMMPRKKTMLNVGERFSGVLRAVLTEFFPDVIVSFVIQDIPVLPNDTCCGRQRFYALLKTIACPSAP